MKQPVLNRRLAPEDAAFLYLERKEAPLHIGSVHTFEGTLPYDDYVRTLHSRLALIPRYRQIVVFPPYNAGFPTWEFDPDFDIKKHIFRVRIDPPGGDAELSALASRLFSTLLDRRKPLWEIHLVEGLSGGRSAIVTRTHHAMVDGMSGVGLINVLTDASPEWKRPKPARYRRAEMPPPEQLFQDAVQSTISGSLERLVEVQKGLLDLGRSIFNQQAMGGIRRMAELMPELAAPVERLPFNRPGCDRKRYVWTEFPLTDVKAIRASLGGTLNDVVLAAQTGAIQRYLKLHREGMKNRLLRVMVPVNVRREDQSHTLGNRVSLLPLSIPLDIADPARLLQAISFRTEAMKHTRLADAISLYGTLLGAIPAPLQALVGLVPFVSTPTPPFNIISTNVRGPDFPIYSVGKRMLTYCPYVPVGHELGIGCAVQSYNGTLYFGITGDEQAAPDVDRIREFLDLSLAGLRKAAGIPAVRRERKALARAATIRATLHASAASAPAPESAPAGNEAAPPPPLAMTAAAGR